MFSKSPLRQVREFIILIVLILLQSCAGAQIAPNDVIAATKVTSLYVIDQAGQGISTTIRMSSPTNNLWLFAKWINEGWVFTSIDMGAKDIIGKWVFCGGGNYTTCKGMADLIDGLLERGWMFREPGDLPPGFMASVAAASGWVRTLHTIPALIIPGESFDILPGLVAPSSGEY
jgi:hypothetical protein